MPFSGDMPHWPTRLLGGMDITIASRNQVAEGFISHALFHRDLDVRPFYSSSANGQVLTMCDGDKDLHEEFSKADQIVADGMPMVLYSKIFGLSLPERVATTDLYHDVAKRAEKEGLSFFLLGGEENINALAVENTKKLYPDLKIAGRRNGYFNQKDEEDIIALINDVEPDFLWVGMGVPREQYFISRNLEKLNNVGVIKTSGGLFDFLSQKRSRAPVWMQKIGFEWVYRALLEPRRLGYRYLKTNPKALCLLFRQS